MLHKKRPLPEEWQKRKIRYYPEIQKYICHAWQSYWGDETVTEEFSPDEGKEMYAWMKAYADAFWVVSVKAVRRPYGQAKSKNSASQ